MGSLSSGCGALSPLQIRRATARSAETGWFRRPLVSLIFGTQHAGVAAQDPAARRGQQHNFRFHEVPIPDFKRFYTD